MSDLKSVKAKRLLAALLRIGWKVKRQTGSHKILERPNWPENVGKGGESNGFKTRRFMK